MVRLRNRESARTTLDISNEAYYIVKAIARDQNRSLGRVIGDLILQSVKESRGAPIVMSDYGFPTFRCTRPVPAKTSRLSMTKSNVYLLDANVLIALATLNTA